MSEQTNTPKPASLRRKIIQAAALLLILVALPALSYFYLYSGAKKQKSIRDDLKATYGQIPASYVYFPGNVKEDQVKSKLCVIYYFGENPQLTPLTKKVIDVSEELFNTYQNTASGDDLRLVMVSGGGSAEFKSYAQTRPSAEYVNWAWTGALGKWKSVLFNAFEYYEKNEGVEGEVTDYFAIADTSGVIRNFYKISDDKALNKMRNHIGFLIPKE